MFRGALNYWKREVEVLKNSQISKEAELLLHQIKDGTSMTASEQLRLVLNLSLPAVLSQITSIIMQYIDAVMVAQLVGAGKENEARDVLRQAIMATVLFSLFLVLIGIAVSYPLPVWLEADETIRRDTVSYFCICIGSLPAIQQCLLAAGMLQCSGNMRTPNLLNVLMCGVADAALGTALAQGVTAVFMVKALLFHSAVLRLQKGDKWRMEKAAYQQNR